MRIGLLVPALAAAGCSQLLGIDDKFTAPDADPGITNHLGVSGHSSITYHTELETQTVAEDLSQLTIDAYIADEAGLHFYPGTGTADGSFEIPDVPARDYHLRLVPKAGGPPSIWHLQGHDVDLSTDRVGRPGTTRLLTVSPVSLTAPAMQRFLSFDSVGVYTSLEAGEATPTWSANQPGLGFDRLTGATFDWSGHPALDDTGVWIIHHGFDGQAGELSITTATEAAHVGSLHQTNGEALPLSLTFAPGVPASTRLTADFGALRQRPTGLDFVSLQLYATPDGGTTRFTGPRLLTVTYQPGEHAPVTSHNISYTDPFPRGWARTASVSYFSLPRFLKAGQSGYLTLDVITSYQTGVPGAPAMLPGLSQAPPAPSGVKLDGAPIADAARSPALPIHLAWDPVPAASYYDVSLKTMSPEGQTGLIEVITTLPEVVIPADTIPDRSGLVISIGAASSAPREPAIRRHFPHASINEQAAAYLLMSSTCGNGVVDPGEGCDTGGESATCNFDCSRPACGDGITNVAAHEECDSGIIGPTCDGQCHVTMCGDHVVTSNEQCDDGNTTDGDGCSARCRVEQLTSCGDHVSDPGEECDDGNRDDLDACTNDCKLVRCGDRLVSTGAGEDCDDGNFITGDGCSAACRVERCGDGIVIYPEQCDDSNTTGGDGCSPQCTRE